MRLLLVCFRSYPVSYPRVSARCLARCSTVSQTHRSVRTSSDPVPSY